MKKVVIVSLFTICICLHAFAKASIHLFDTPIQGNVQLVKVGSYSYCIAGNVIYQVEKKKLVQKAMLQQECNDAAVYNGTIALATGNGIQLFDTKTNTIAALLPEVINGTINQVQTDAKNHLWFTKMFEGCFTIDDNGQVLQKVKVPATYALAYTGNGNMWVGTNVGLYKVPVNGSAITRYAEEGIASNELPDNLVERLFADAQSNVWVMMPGHITFIAAESEEEFPDYQYIGKKDNELYDISTANATGQAYLFATAQGILLMHGLTHGEELHTGEIHQPINEKAYLLTDVITGKPASLQHEAVTKIKTCGSETYFITHKGMWSVNTQAFAKKLKRRFNL